MRVQMHLQMRNPGGSATCVRACSVPFFVGGQGLGTHLWATPGFAPPCTRGRTSLLPAAGALAPSHRGCCRPGLCPARAASRLRSCSPSRWQALSGSRPPCCGRQGCCHPGLRPVRATSCPRSRSPCPRQAVSGSVGPGLGVGPEPWVPCCGRQRSSVAPSAACSTSVSQGRLLARASAHSCGSVNRPCAVPGTLWHSWLNGLALLASIVKEHELLQTWCHAWYCSELCTSPGSGQAPQRSSCAWLRAFVGMAAPATFMQACEQHCTGIRTITSPTQIVYNPRRKIY